MSDAIWAIALLLTDGEQRTRMTLTVASGTERDVREKAAFKAMEDMPGFMVSEALAHGVLDDR